jgi:hypothetical protein
MDEYATPSPPPAGREGQRLCEEREREREVGQREAADVLTNGGFGMYFCQPPPRTPLAAGRVSVGAEARCVRAPSLHTPRGIEGKHAQAIRPLPTRAVAFVKRG